MQQTLCILGRQPALGRAELESLYGANVIRPIGDIAALVNIEPQFVDFSRLGGTIKFCKVLSVLDTQDWTKIQDYLEKVIPSHVVYLPEGKMRLGLSTFGLKVSVKRLNASGLQLKKIIRATGRSVRVIPNTELVLNSAQVLHNQLTGSLGWELIFIADGKKTILAQNIAEQDIEAYTKRDQNRPKRDARIGMLPPKLAQIIINLASGKTAPLDPSCGPSANKGLNVLDPFCGTGVIMQEALLMGYSASGTDIDPRMVDYSKVNLAWLAKTFPVIDSYTATVGDATTLRWVPSQLDIVASESYLGRPFSSPPKPVILDEVIRDVDTIYKKFVKNLALQTSPGFRACVAVPCWATSGKFTHLSSLDHLEKLGYTRVSFAHATNQELVYHRPGQIVARELVVMVRK